MSTSSDTSSLNLLAESDVGDGVQNDVEKMHAGEPPGIVNVEHAEAPGEMEPGYVSQSQDPVLQHPSANPHASTLNFPQAIAAPETDGVSPALRLCFCHNHTHSPFYILLMLLLLGL